MEKLLRVKASKFINEVLNLLAVEEVIHDKYDDVAYSDIKVIDDYIDVKFTLLVDSELDITYVEKVIHNVLIEFIEVIEKNIELFSTNVGLLMMNEELNDRIIDMEGVLLSD